MKLLFDQNLSFRVSRAVVPIFPGSMQVKDGGLENKTDLEIWYYAREKDFVIVTFDADFADIQSLKGFPPKIIWLRFFDQCTEIILAKIKEKEKQIKEFDQADFGILEIK